MHVVTFKSLLLIFSAYLQSFLSHWHPAKLLQLLMMDRNIVFLTVHENGTVGFSYMSNTLTLSLRYYILVMQRVTSQVLHWFYNSSFLHINIRIFMNSCKFYQIRKTVYPILCRFRKKVPFDLFGWTVCWSKSFKANLTSWICVKALLLQRKSLQGEIELPLESTKLESKSDFWRHFRAAKRRRS